MIVVAQKQMRFQIGKSSWGNTTTGAGSPEACVATWRGPGRAALPRSPHRPERKVDVTSPQRHASRTTHRERRTHAAPWKSGGSAPRKAHKKNPGFSPWTSPPDMMSTTGKTSVVPLAPNEPPQALTWKSGASAPRKAQEKPGFSPSGRRLQTQARRKPARTLCHSESAESPARNPLSASTTTNEGAPPFAHFAKGGIPRPHPSGDVEAPRPGRARLKSCRKPA